MAAKVERPKSIENTRAVGVIHRRGTQQIMAVKVDNMAFLVGEENSKKSSIIAG